MGRNERIEKVKRERKKRGDIRREESKRRGR